MKLPEECPFWAKFAIYQKLYVLPVIFAVLIGLMLFIGPSGALVRISFSSNVPFVSITVDRHVK
jgi:hypothetical protein